MSVVQTCTKCPYFHPIGEDCPPGWHEVPSQTRLDRRRFWTGVVVWLVLPLLFWGGVFFLIFHLAGAL